MPSLTRPSWVTSSMFSWRMRSNILRQYRQKAINRALWQGPGFLKEKGKGGMTPKRRRARVGSSLVDVIN